MNTFHQGVEKEPHERKKNDVRSRYTESVIYDALMKLIAIKPLKKITVAEICAACEINRGTFYNHFYDVYDAYEKLSNVFFQKLWLILEDKNICRLNYEFFKTIMDIASENQALVALELSNPSESALLRCVTEKVKLKFCDDFTKLCPHIDDKVLNDLFVYALNGSIGIVGQWLKSDLCDTDAVAHRIDFLNKALFSNVTALFADLT